MTTYTAENTLVLAKRHHNTKRTYLLVNPLQAKHIPVSPSEALSMMTCLGRQVADNHPKSSLVIGFAETATAIAAVVSGCFGPQCRYIHTTRETYTGDNSWLHFNEEHSHAVEQKLCSICLEQWIAQSEEIIFVDDEISTGKTLLNIIEQLQQAIPSAHNKKFVAASIINRLSPEHEQRFKQANVECEYLVKLQDDDLTEAVSQFHIHGANPIVEDSSSFTGEILYPSSPFMDPRLGVTADAYIKSCRELAQKLTKELTKRLPKNANILVLGTEECMYPSLILGQELEKQPDISSVRCHSTTRSPIGICTENNYPIRSGIQLHSFYDENRVSYLYNLKKYDAAVIVTDSAHKDRHALADLEIALRGEGCEQLLLIEGGTHVQFI